MGRSKAGGISLVELLITLAIVAILATITVPSYSGLVAKSRRGDAMAALVLVELAQQRWRTQHPRYARQLQDLGWPTPASPDGYYHLRITKADAVEFRVLAQPVGPQQSDTCGTFAAGSNGPVYEAGFAGPRCWSR